MAITMDHESPTPPPPAELLARPSWRISFLILTTLRFRYELALTQLLNTEEVTNGARISKSKKGRWEGYKEGPIPTMGAAQKNLVDGWTWEDYEEMGVSREEVLRELEYDEVLRPLSKQHDNVEERKRRSREKIAAIWGEEWEVEFEDNEMPPWQSEHFLQHMFALAKESPCPSCVERSYRSQSKKISIHKEGQVSHGPRRQVGHF